MSAAEHRSITPRLNPISDMRERPHFRDAEINRIATIVSLPAPNLDDLSKMIVAVAPG